MRVVFFLFTCVNACLFGFVQQKYYVVKYLSRRERRRSKQRKQTALLLLLLVKEEKATHCDYDGGGGKSRCGLDI